MKTGVTLEEGAGMLIARILAGELRDGREVVAIFRDVEKKAIHEAAIVFRLGGPEALIRLFEHHGIQWSQPLETKE
jgi:pyruvate kinase